MTSARRTPTRSSRRWKRSRRDDQGRPQGSRRPQGPRPVDRTGGRHRRVDGERHVRAHRHDAESVRRHLRGVLRGHRRRRQRQAARRVLHRWPRHRPRLAAQGHRGPSRRRLGRGRPAGPAEQLQPRQAARQQGPDHRPCGRDDGRRHRRRRPSVLPAQAQAGRLGGRRRRDRPRRRHGEQAGLRGRRHDQGRRHRPGPAVQGHGHRHLRVRRLAGQRLAGHLRPPDRPGPVRQGRRLRQHLREGGRRHLAGAAGGGDQAAAAQDRRRQDRRRPGGR